MRRHSLPLHRSIGAHPQAGIRPLPAHRGTAPTRRSAAARHSRDRQDHGINRIGTEKNVGPPGARPRRFAAPACPSRHPVHPVNAGAAERPLGRLTDLRSLIFAAFLIATRLKLGDRLAWCPVDPTTLLGLAVGTMALWRLIKKDFRLPANTPWVW